MLSVCNVQLTMFQEVFNIKIQRGQWYIIITCLSEKVSRNMFHNAVKKSLYLHTRSGLICQNGMLPLGMYDKAECSNSKYNSE
jgi:hypothetical protein